MEGFGRYAYQDAFVTSATTAAKSGAQVAQVPHHTFSIWNNYQILPKLGAGLPVALVNNDASLLGTIHF